jgi:hypothetical protein
MAGMNRRAAIVAVAPVIAAAGAVIAAYAFSIDARAVDAAVASPYLILGLFAERFPVLAFAVIYALARLIMVALNAVRPMVLIRLVAVMPALVLLMAAALYPTFGGFIARPAFILGGFSLINAVTTGSWMAIAAGGALAGVMLGLVTALGRAMIDWQWRPGLARIARAILALGAYAFAGAALAAGWWVLSSAGALFPRAPLTLVETVALTGLVIAATAPLAALTAWGEAARRPAKP